MTPNCANIISNMDERCHDIPLQGKHLEKKPLNSRKLRKVVVIYKTNKVVLFKKYMSLKTRGLEKVTYSKSSCSRFLVLL